MIFSVFPKTDYTYSQTSQCRYEIAPGVLAMPNMSRPSIHSDGSNSTVGSTLSLSQQTLSQASASAKEEEEEATDLLDCDLNDSIQQNRLVSFFFINIYIPIKLLKQKKSQIPWYNYFKNKYFSFNTFRTKRVPFIYQP